MALIKAADEALGKDLLQRGEKKTYKRDYFTECNQVETCTECRREFESCCMNKECIFGLTCKLNWRGPANAICVDPRFF